MIYIEFIGKGFFNKLKLNTVNIQSAIMPVVIYPIVDEIEKNLGFESINNRCSLSRYPKIKAVPPKDAKVRN